MRFASLFAGVGGFDLAFERAGMECVAQVEIDTRCREVLATHWPDVPRFEDVHEVSATDLGAVDVLCGGFPCQDYSVAGRRGGLAGDRGALWWQFHRLIDECRPRWVVGENVPGLLSSNGGRDFGAIVGSLVELGYGVVWRVLDAQYFGVAQRRRRVFIVGHIGGIPRPEILAFAEGCSGDTPPRRGERQAAPTSAAGSSAKGGRFVAELIGTLQSVRRGVPSAEESADGQLIVEPRAHFGIQGGEVGVVGVVLNGGAEHPADEGEFGGGEGHSESFRLTDDDLTNSSFNVNKKVPFAFNWQNAGHEGLALSVDHSGPLDISQTKAIAFAQNTRDEVRDLHDLDGGLMQEDIAYALTSPDGGGRGQERNIFAGAVRRLTPLECERLQGFPDNWTASQSDTQRYRQMGNAVAVPVAEWIGKRLVAV